jgi:predicted kinase
MVCGKIAAGKSTLASRLGRSNGTILVAEDAWLEALFADQLSSLSDYARCSSRLRRIIGPHISSLLRAGVSVVLDFPANTVEQRGWCRGIFEAAGASHRLHVLEASDEFCLARLRARQANGDHPFAVTEEQYRQFARYYEPPSPEEGFNIMSYAQN